MVSISRMNAEKVEVAFDSVLYGAKGFALISIGKTTEISISKRDEDISCVVRYAGVSIIIDDCILAGMCADKDYLLIIGKKSDIQIPIRN